MMEETGKHVNLNEVWNRLPDLGIGEGINGALNGANKAFQACPSAYDNAKYCESTWNNLPYTGDVLEDAAL